jgi:hypothetical protein
MESPTIYTYISMHNGDKVLLKGDSRDIQNTNYGNTYEEGLKLNQKFGENASNRTSAEEKRSIALSLVPSIMQSVLRYGSQHFCSGIERRHGNPGIRALTQIRTSDFRNFRLKCVKKEALTFLASMLPYVRCAGT